MLGSSRVAAQLAASQEGLSFMSDYYYYYYYYYYNYYVSLRVSPSNPNDFSLFGVCPSNKHCPSARCAYAAKVVGKYLDIFATGTVSLNYIYTHQPKIVNIICS
jgi:hypothetical protein